MIVGMPGSGKSIVSDVVRDYCRAPVYVMGDIVREETIKRGLPPTLENTRAVAERLREEMGPRAVAYLLLKKIVEERPQRDYIVIDGARSLAEIECFREAFDDVIIIAVHSSPRTRFRRLVARGRRDDPRDWREFISRDLSELSLGMGSVIALADYVIVNEETSIEELRSRVLELLEKVIGGRCV